ncbi:Glp-like protein [Pholiota conissans]|uniref:Glp-like protein n=1 Tax=Pholiota conissans TaxID=109636 RepID=A0A9P6D7T7_9AGAR|nr:Glp-like protein [Pholiota conissans]
MPSFKSTFALLLAVSITRYVRAETHTVHFSNNCGFGTPTLIQGPNILSQGNDVTFNGPLFSAIAYLQTGGCGFNGEGCTLIETTLTNPVNGPGSGSSTDISLIPPHSFSVTSGFGYFGGCDGAGADCTSPSCTIAFPQPGDTDKQVTCQADNVNLAITFCV